MQDFEPLGFAASLVEEWFGVKNLIRITIMAKVMYYAKEKTMVSTNRPKVLAFASNIVERELTVSMPYWFLP